MVFSRRERIAPGLRSFDAPCAFGTWVKIPSMETVELLAKAGFDFVVIDLEHSPLNIETAYRLIFTAQSCGMTALVRVPDRSGSHVQRVLDAGADGILVPQVSSLEQARVCLDHMTFSPDGVRGMGLTSRAGGWGLDGRDSYVGSQSELVRALQIEDLASLRQGPEFVRLDGLDALFVGYGDLSLSTGLAPSDPAIQDPLRSLLSATSEAGLPIGTAVADAVGAKRAAAQGFSFVMVSNDTSLFGRAATSLIQSIEESS